MTRRKLDKIIFIDLEASTWDSREDQGNQLHEIIEIGVCNLHLKTGEITDKKSYMVKPYNSTISQYCTELTGITPELIKKEGIPFKDAINKLKKDFGPKYRTWASWGFYDKRMIEIECERHNIPYPMGRNHINAKNLFALKHHLKDELGMIEALKYAQIELEGVVHRGADDAYNSAKLLWTVLK